ncbi:hypothetical protein BHM03_00009440 [Ensete ventricosum]|nr:hypothetical protein BHM03_00009440 [Ensete ventricosum]
MVSMSMMRGNPRTGGGHPGATPSIPAPAPPPPPAPCIESESTSDVQEIPIEEVRGAPEVSYKRRGEDPVVLGWTAGIIMSFGCATFRRGLPTLPLSRSKASDPWNDGLAERGSFGHIHLRHANPVASHRSVYSAVRGVDGRGIESYGADLEMAQVESASLERQIDDLQKRLDDSEGQLRGARAQVCQMETELLDLTRSKDVLREELPRRAIEDYKKSPEFEMDLMWMGRVSLEYGYQLALAHLQARHLG